MLQPSFSALILMCSVYRLMIVIDYYDFSAMTASHALVVTIFMAAESFTEMNK